MHNRRNSTTLNERRHTQIQKSPNSNLTGARTPNLCILRSSLHDQEDWAEHAGGEEVQHDHGNADNRHGFEGSGQLDGDDINVAILSFFSLHAALALRPRRKACLKQVASPVHRFCSVCLREGHWPPENKPLPGGAGGVALWPSRRLLPGRNGLRTGLTGLNQVPAATRLLDCLKTMLGTLSWYLWPTRVSASHHAPTKTSGWCALPEVIVFAAHMGETALQGGTNDVPDPQAGPATMSDHDPAASVGAPGRDLTPMGRTPRERRARGGGIERESGYIYV